MTEKTPQHIAADEAVLKYIEKDIESNKDKYPFAVRLLEEVFKPYMLLMNEAQHVGEHSPATVSNALNMFISTIIFDMALRVCKVGDTASMLEFSQMTVNTVAEQVSTKLGEYAASQQAGAVIQQ